jgi:hypothetical protein
MTQEDQKARERGKKGQETHKVENDDEEDCQWPGAWGLGPSSKTAFVAATRRQLSADSSDMPAAPRRSALTGSELIPGFRPAGLGSERRAGGGG